VMRGCFEGGGCGVAVVGMAGDPPAVEAEQACRAQRG
jgi:hypothetical protein